MVKILKQSSSKCIFIMILFTFLPQSNAANCSYAIDHENHKYTCVLKNAHVLLGNYDLIIEGTHLQGYSDDDVKVISISDSVIHTIQNTIFEKFKNLEEFLIIDGEVQAINSNALEFCEKLETFHIVDAELNKIPSRLFENCKKLKELTFDNCGITTLENDVFYGIDKELQKLDLSGNKLKSLSSDIFEGLIRLKELYLASNEIESISESAFNDLIEMEKLMLNSNKIKSTLPSSIFKTLTNLTELDLRKNSISELKVDLFKELKNLKILDLSSNDIKELPEEIFTSLSNLKSIYLDFNNIKRLFINSFGEHNQTLIFTIDNNKLYSIQPGFFNNFASLAYFHATENDCMDDYIFNDDNPIDFSDKKVKDILHDCYYFHDPPKGFGEKYITLLWIGLGVAVASCAFLYGLHFYFVRSLKREAQIQCIE